MTHIKSISIPQACHESWQQMTPTEKGRYCNSCCKVVTDFTGMSNEEVISYLAGKTNSCGRFGAMQLSNINHQLYIQNQQPANPWKRLVLFTGVITSSICFRAAAQTTPEITQHSVTKQNGKGKVTSTFKTEFSPDRIITGKVLDDTLAVVGATVMVKGQDVKIYTGINGEYKINVPDNADTLTVSFIGYETAYIPINANQTNYDVKLKSDPRLNDVVFVGGVSIVAVKLPLYKRLWYKIKHIF